MSELAKNTDGAVTQTLEWLAEGHCETDIVENLREHFPNIDPALIIEATVERLEDIAAEHSDRVHGWAMNAYHKLYRKMYEIGDFSNAMRCVKEIVALSKRG